MADELHLQAKVNIYSTRGWPAMLRPGGFGDVEAGDFIDLETFLSHAEAQGYEPHVSDRVYAQLVDAGAAPAERSEDLAR